MSTDHEKRHRHYLEVCEKFSQGLDPLHSQVLMLALYTEQHIWSFLQAELPNADKIDSKTPISTLRRFATSIADAAPKDPTWDVMDKVAALRNTVAHPRKEASDFEEAYDKLKGALEKIESIDIGITAAPETDEDFSPLALALNALHYIAEKPPQIDQVVAAAWLTIDTFFHVLASRHNHD